MVIRDTATTAKVVSPRIAVLHRAGARLRNGIGRASADAVMRKILSKQGVANIYQLKQQQMDKVLLEFRAALALALAKIGPIFPVIYSIKRPAIKEWEKQATQDPIVIREWCKRFPDCNWGISVDVVDVDALVKPGNTKSGIETINPHIIEHGEPNTLTVTTPTGGTHLYLKASKPDEWPNGTNTLGEGIDSRAARKGYVVAPGSYVIENAKEKVSATGYYTTKLNMPISAVPWLEAMVGSYKGPRVERGDVIEEPEPLIRNETLAAALAELDPVQFRDQDKWWRLMCSCHSATGGIGYLEFSEFSLRDTEYSGDNSDIEGRWNSLHVHKDDRGDITLHSNGGLLDCLKQSGHGDLMQKVSIEADHLTDADPDFEKREAEAVKMIADAVPPDSLVMVNAADVEPERIDFLWPDRLALGIHTALAGEGGKGKSQWLYYTTMVITTGGKWPTGERCPKGWVVILSAEENTNTMIVPRLIAAGADRSMVRILRAVKKNGVERKFSLQDDLRLLRDECRKLAATTAADGKKYPVLMIGIDPASSYMGGAVEGRSNIQVRNVLDPLSQLAEDLRCAVVSITHFNKGSGAKAVHRVMDSAAFANAPRAVFGFFDDATDIGVEDGPERKLFLMLKTNMKWVKGMSFHLESAPGGTDHRDGQVIEATRLVWEGETDMTADEVMQLENARGAPEQTNAKMWLLEYLADGPKPAKEVREAAQAQPISYGTLRIAAKALGVKSQQVAGVAHGGWTWALPEGE